MQKICAADGPVRVVVVGAGAAGTELACNMQVRVRNEYKKKGKTSDHVRFTLVSRRPTICPSHNKRVQKMFLQVCREVNSNPFSSLVEVFTSHNKSCKWPGILNMGEEERGWGRRDFSPETVFCNII